MFAIMGAAGKVGYATSLALREANMLVRAVLRDDSKAARLSDIGCDIAIADFAHVGFDIGMPTMYRTLKTRISYLKGHKPLPIVSAPNVSKIAAGILLQAIKDKGLEVIHAEGPRCCSVDDVAAALSQLLGQKIKVEVAPRGQWKRGLEHGMSASLAKLLTKANDALNKGGLIDVEPDGEVIHGTTDLLDGLRPLLPPL
ncbi:hypothetical protein F5883DRAFT_695598 [Diaporthe sp. PMI_573]|nr:hypothetical protein F5883DRAFT_695598 [Diaporthaceae sp. PMI_573]